MGKKNHTPARLDAVKAQKKSSDRFSRGIKAKRREKYYAAGKGSVGMLVRRPRLARYIRRICKDENERYERITGVSSKAGTRLAKSCVDVVQGGVDAYANRLLAIAKEISKGGKKLKAQDVQRAASIIAEIARH